jgi:hypothetical protein
MFMGRDWKYWAMVAGFGALGMAWVVFQPDVYQAHVDVLTEQFHLPEDVEFEVLASDHGGRHVVQFTPGQYNNYVRSFDDAQLWSMGELEWYGVEVEAAASSRAMTWWDTNEAFHDGTSFPSYLHWGHAMGDAVWDVEPSHSFCFAVVGEGAEQSVYQCGDYQDRPWPEFYVRGIIDPEGQRLFAYISTG